MASDAELARHYTELGIKTAAQKGEFAQLAAADRALQVAIAKARAAEALGRALGQVPMQIIQGEPFNNAVNNAGNLHRVRSSIIEKLFGPSVGAELALTAPVKASLSPKAAQVIEAIQTSQALQRAAGALRAVPLMALPVPTAEDAKRALLQRELDVTLPQGA